MRVNEIMSTPVVTIGAAEPAARAWDVMRLEQMHHLVVLGGDDRVVGVISDADLGGKSGNAVREGHRVSELMTDKVVTVHPETTVREAANLMRGHAVNCLPVFDRSERLKGIVTVVDLLELLGRGSARPMETAPRAVLKNRGVAPRQSLAGPRSRAAKR